jgi:1-deoxy-D-xylulose-5-phosphate reductoisomerase
VFNAANEVAVAAFLDRRVGFAQIGDLIAHVLDGHRAVPADSIDAVRSADRWARARVRELIR